MDAGMTSLAKGNEVLPCVGPAFRQRYLMMHFLNRHVLPGKQTKLAEWMCLYIAVTNLLPGPPVSFLMGWVPLVSVVPLALKPFMLRAILLLGKVGTARICTGFLWFSWHFLLLPSGNKKAHQFLADELLLLFSVRCFPVLYFSDYTISQRAPGHPWTFLDILKNFCFFHRSSSLNSI